MIAFKAWCKKLESFMKAIDLFNLVTQSDNNFNVYTLLSSLWQAKSSTHKKMAVEIVKQFDKNA